MFYTDIHSHMLCGIDDGAKDEAVMHAMLDMAYKSGTRTLCLTPHFQPRFYGNNIAASKAVFERLCAYAEDRYPDMQLSLANELGYYTDCLSAVTQGDCRLLGGRYLLMDFLPGTPLFTIRYAMEETLSAGHNVILAHVERYESLIGEEDLLSEWERRGARFQVNASSFSKKTGGKEKRRIKKLMSRALIHAVASDAHDPIARPPMLSEAEEVITARFGDDVARLLLDEFPSRIVSGKRI